MNKFPEDMSKKISGRIDKEYNLTVNRGVALEIDTDYFFRLQNTRTGGRYDLIKKVEYRRGDTSRGRCINFNFDKGIVKPGDFVIINRVGNYIPPDREKLYGLQLKQFKPLDFFGGGHYRILLLFKNQNSSILCAFEDQQELLSSCPDIEDMESIKKTYALLENGDWSEYRYKYPFYSIDQEEDYVILRYIVMKKAFSIESLRQMQSKNVPKTEISAQSKRNIPLAMLIITTKQFLEILLNASIQEEIYAFMNQYSNIENYSGSRNVKEIQYVLQREIYKIFLERDNGTRKINSPFKPSLLKKAIIEAKPILSLILYGEIPIKNSFINLLELRDIIKKKQGESFNMGEFNKGLIWCINNKVFHRAEQGGEKGLRIDGL